MDDAGAASVWARVIADPGFRDALVADPLRAVAGAPGLEVAPEAVRRLEAMTVAERAELVEGLVLEATRRRIHQMWGERFWTPDDGEGPPG